MQAFQKAISADYIIAEAERDNLYELRESIGYAIALNNDQFRPFAQIGLTHDTLTSFDRDIEHYKNSDEPIHSMTKKDLDILIPFIQNLGKAYSQLMEDSFAANQNNDGKTIQHAGALHPILNFFYAQKAKLYPDPSNAPTYRNE
jgi:hypothetical protein